jgi:hypothetical protein
VTYRTFGDLRQQVEAELDTQDEEFIGETEIQNYFNSGVTVCEATIVKLGLREKYLQSEAYITTVVGTADYDLPSDIVINKLRKIIYRNGTLIYTVNPLRSEDGYEAEDVMNANSDLSEYYRYSIYKMGTTYKLRLTPKAGFTVSNALRVIYFKTLNRYTADSVLCDLPDICYEYLMSYVRYRVYAKESHTNMQDEKGNMQALMILMQETLQNQVGDPDMDTMDQDTSHYEEMI